jgi:hypothetical protein
VRLISISSTNSAIIFYSDTDYIAKYPALTRLLAVLLNNCHTRDVLESQSAVLATNLLLNASKECSRIGITD